MTHLSVFDILWHFPQVHAGQEEWIRIKIQNSRARQMFQGSTNVHWCTNGWHWLHLLRLSGFYLLFRLSQLVFTFTCLVADSAGKFSEQAVSFEHMMVSHINGPGDVAAYKTLVRFFSSGTFADMFLHLLISCRHLQGAVSAQASFCKLCCWHFMNSPNIFQMS